eukprot:7396090-Heterocapsa_arctica.AAC.1
MNEEQVATTHTALIEVCNDAIAGVELKKAHRAEGRADVPPGSCATAVRLEHVHSKSLLGSKRLLTLITKVLLDKLTLGRRGRPHA